LDERKNNGKDKIKEDEIETQNTDFLGRHDTNFEELRQIMQASTGNILLCMNELIQASKPRSSKRMYFELFRALIEENAQSSESILYLFEYAINLRASVLLLSAEVEKTKGHTPKDDKRLRIKLNNLLNSPAMVEIGKILKNMERISKEKECSSGKNPSSDYLR
jgi:hypothetical protein